jgi:ABC-type siderophore export system fused ATPase/permease subunit
MGLITLIVDTDAVEDTRKFFSAVLEGCHLVSMHLGDCNKTLEEIEQACATKKNPKKTIEQILTNRSKQNE